MSDDKSKRSRDRSRISLGEEYEVRYWSQKFGVSRQELEQAVKAVGNDATKVGEHLRSHKGEQRPGKGQQRPSTEQRPAKSQQRPSRGK